MFDKRELQYEGYEAHIDGEFHHGIILEVTKEGLMVRPFHKDHVWSKGYDKYDPYWIPKEDFDKVKLELWDDNWGCLLYTSPSPRDQRGSRMPSSA